MTRKNLTEDTRAQSPVSNIGRFIGSRLSIHSHRNRVVKGTDSDMASKDTRLMASVSTNAGQATGHCDFGDRHSMCHGDADSGKKVSAATNSVRSRSPDNNAASAHDERFQSSNKGVSSSKSSLSTPVQQRPAIFTVDSNCTEPTPTNADLVGFARLTNNTGMDASHVHPVSRDSSAEAICSTCPPRRQQAMMATASSPTLGAHYDNLTTVSTTDNQCSINNDATANSVGYRTGLSNCSVSTSSSKDDDSASLITPPALTLPPPLHPAPEPHDKHFELISTMSVSPSITSAGSVVMIPDQNVGPDSCPAAVPKEQPATGAMASTPTMEQTMEPVKSADTVANLPPTQQRVPAIMTRLMQRIIPSHRKLFVAGGATRAAAATAAAAAIATVAGGLKRCENSRPVTPSAVVLIGGTDGAVVAVPYASVAAVTDGVGETGTLTGAGWTRWTAASGRKSPGQLSRRNDDSADGESHARPAVVDSDSADTKHSSFTRHQDNEMPVGGNCDESRRRKWNRRLSAYSYRRPRSMCVSEPTHNEMLAPPMPQLPPAYHLIDIDNQRYSQLPPLFGSNGEVFTTDGAAGEGFGADVVQAITKAGDKAGDEAERHIYEQLQLAKAGKSNELQLPDGSFSNIKLKPLPPRPVVKVTYVLPPFVHKSTTHSITPLASEENLRERSNVIDMATQRM